MINLLKKFRYIIGSATVQHIEDNMVYLNGKNAKIKLIGSDIYNLFKILPIIATNNKPLAEVPSGHTFDYDSLIKCSLKEVEFNNEHQLYAMFENCYSNQIVCENVNLPQIKMDNIRPVEQVTNHAFVFDSYLWVTDSHYLLRSELNINKDIKLNIPAHIFNLLKKIAWIGKNGDIIQISGWVDSKHQIVIQYNALQTEVIERYISMLKRVSGPLDTCDDGIIYDLTEITNLKLSNKRMENFIRYNDGLISVYNNTFNCNTDEFKHDLFNNVLKKFTVDASYLKMFKKLFKKANIKTLGTLSGRTTSITLHDKDNSLLLMCISE